ncbi:bifunctional adenosylcobinamide kinase/adenosylcobinamide-phosphate guanylyltransferase [Profundibacter sp.]
MLADLTLIIGGAASGKSDFAEGLVMACGNSRIYLATAQAHDGEMAAKISRHQKTRGDGWRTVEAPLELSPALASASKNDVVLLDCATLWLTNQMMTGSDLETAQDALQKALASCKAPVVVVTNEVGAGIVPENKLARQFREAQGRLNQRLAAHADLAVMVVAGLPMVLKGTLPT